MYDNIMSALDLVLMPGPLLAILFGAFFGLFVGAIPGLTATMATALLVPLTFFLDPLPAIAAIVACSAMAICAGDIPGALLRIPGTPASAAYVDESYAMTQKGEAATALGTLLLSAVIGGLFGAVILSFMSPTLARFAIRFSSFEYFWLSVLGLSCVVLIAGSSPVRALVAVCIGLLISTVGLDTMSGQPRYAFGVIDLYGGISFIPTLIGLFAIAEIIRALAERKGRLAKRVPPVPGGLARGVAKVYRRYWFGSLRGSTIGTCIGILPGAGGDLAAWVSYALSKRFSRTPAKFGTGHPEGLVDAGSSNNAGLSGAWVPALVFGIPGDAITAIAIGVLFMKGLNPGPTLFTTDAPMLYAVFICFILANLLMLPLGYIAIRLSSLILAVPRETLMPLILVCCIVGAFAVENSMFAVGIMFVMGIVGYLMDENGFPIAPLTLGLIMGPLIERTLTQSMIVARGDVLVFLDRPVSLVLGLATLAIWSTILLSYARRRLSDMRGKRSEGPAV